MADPVFLGQFEQLVLTAILALDGNAYGVPIHAKVEGLSRPKKGARRAVYAPLDRLEDKRLLASRTAEPAPERGGRSRRHHRPAKSGARAPRAPAAPGGRLYETIAEGGLAWKPSRCPRPGGWKSWSAG